MKRKNYLYCNEKQLESLISSGDLNANANYFICIHTAAHIKQDIPALISVFNKLFPNSKMIGTSACDIIYEGKLYDNKCLISFMEFSDTDVDINIFDCTDKSAAALANEVMDRAYTPVTSLIYTFFSDMYSGAARFVDELDRQRCKAKLIGGYASNSRSGAGDSFVFTSDGVFPNSLLTASLCNEKLLINNITITGYDTVGDYHTITAVNNAEIVEIDDTPATKWFRDITGCDTFLDINDANYDGHDDVLIRFPLLIKGYNSSSRSLQYHAVGNKLTQYFVDGEVGQKFRIGYLSRTLSANAWENACSVLTNTPIESMFCYSCALRKVWFGDCAEWELKPFSNADVCGALLYGEIGNADGRNEFLNGTCNLLTIAEKRKYIDINSSLMRDVRTTQDKFRNYYYNVLENFNRQMYDKNNSLMLQIEKQENYLNDKIFIDANTGMDNINKLMADNKDNKYSSACLITVESGELTVSHFGIKEFGRIMAQSIGEVYAYLKENYADLNAYIYIYDEYSFLLVSDADAPNERFIESAKDLYKHFGTCHVEGVSYSYVNRFIVVVNEKDMLDKIKLVKANVKSLPEDRLFIYDAAVGLETAVEKLIHATKVINYAIENDGVVPYFQPIYDNSTGKIDKFEALMRLRDNEGKIYFPGQFMDAAKKQGLYSQISRIVINKVFDLFENRTETVSINLSAIDINSTETCNMIYDRLKKIGNAERFIFEVLESEEFRDQEGLKEFINRVREHNVKIAIDDFGSGFSNLLEIARLSPNFIKIDGQIVREVVDSEMHRKIIGTILHLAEKFDIDLIAEFIENERLQDYASNNGVRYSQGYYFSQAVPFEQIDDVIKSK